MTEESRQRLTILKDGIEKWVDSINNLTKALRDSVPKEEGLRMPSNQEPQCDTAKKEWRMQGTRLLVDGIPINVGAKCQIILNGVEFEAYISRYGWQPDYDYFGPSITLVIPERHKP